MKTESPLNESFPFLRNKKCVFCSLYSIQTKPGFYYQSRESSEVIVTSNNPNQIYEAIYSKNPPRQAFALDTAGFTINEARALGKIDQEIINRKISELTNKGGYDVYITDSISALLSSVFESENIILLESNDRLEANNLFNKILIRCLVGLRLGVAYSLLMLPLMLIDFDIMLRSIIVFIGTMLFSAAIFPKNKTLNLITFLFFGVLISNFLFINNPTTMLQMRIIMNIFSGLLWGGLAWIIMNR